MIYITTYEKMDSSQDLIFDLLSIGLQYYTS